jgi:hypothetical protein
MAHAANLHRFLHRTGCEYAALTGYRIGSRRDPQHCKPSRPCSIVMRICGILLQDQETHTKGDTSSGADVDVMYKASHVDFISSFPASGA